MLFTSLIQNKQFIKYIITNYKDKTINTIICIGKMSQKSVHSLNIQNKSPIKNNPFCDEDHTEVPSKISTSKKLPLTSPMFSYFSDSHVYLNRKYSENIGNDLLNSKNFLRKDSLCPNDETKDNEEENGSNIMYSEENEDEENEVSEEEDEEYGQLNANGVYNQQYKNQTNNNISSSNNNNKNNIPLFRFNLNQQFNLMTINQIQQQQRPRFNSGNFILQSPNQNQMLGQNYIGNMYPNNPIANYNNNINQVPYQVEMFGRKGWLCHVCNNFNYDTRNKCNRCHESGSPKKSKKKISKAQMSMNSGAQNMNNKNNKMFSERIGDWNCFHCNNLNFAFRTVCNRCQLSKEESDAFLMKFQMNNINEGQN